MQDVVNRQQQIVDECTSSKNVAGYFAALYKRMTQAIQGNINASLFEDNARMEKLDAVFAQRMPRRGLGTHAFVNENGKRETGCRIKFQY